MKIKELLESVDVSYIEQKLADYDINAKVSVTEIKVDDSDVAEAKKIAKKIGAKQKVVGGLNK